MLYHSENICVKIYNVSQPVVPKLYNQTSLLAITSLHLWKIIKWINIEHFSNMRRISTVRNIFVFSEKYTGIDMLNWPWAAPQKYCYVCMLVNHHHVHYFITSFVKSFVLLLVTLWIKISTSPLLRSQQVSSSSDIMLS